VRFIRRSRLAATKFYQVFGIGLMFAISGVGSVILSAFVLPLFNLGKHDDAKELRAQAAIQWVFATFLKVASGVGVISVEYQSLAKLEDGPCLVLANHPTILDVVLLGALLPQCDCVVKGDAWNNFFLRGIVTAAGYIINSDGPGLVRECSNRLRAGRSVLLFPEGTRSPESGLQPFARGASRIAIESGCPIQPITIQCTPPALMKGQSLLDLPPERLCFVVEVNDAVYAKDLVDSKTPPGVTARRLNDRLRAHFATRLGYGSGDDIA